VIALLVTGANIKLRVLHLQDKRSLEYVETVLSWQVRNIYVKYGKQMIWCGGCIPTLYF
jgi:hypothetical protein